MNLRERHDKRTRLQASLWPAFKTVYWYGTGEQVELLKEHPDKKNLLNWFIIITSDLNLCNYQ